MWPHRGRRQEEQSQRSSWSGWALPSLQSETTQTVLARMREAGLVPWAGARSGARGVTQRDEGSGNKQKGFAKRGVEGQAPGQGFSAYT